MKAFHGVALGCGNFGGIGSAPEFFGQGIDEETALRIMDAAWAGGIHWFDTGDAYGGGRSESFIGRWVREHRPEGLVLTTKVFHSTTGTPGDHGLAPDRIRRQLEGSLARLGVDRVDLYLAHEPDEAVPLERTVATFEALRSEGLIGAWGLSNYDAAGVREALAVAAPALVQNSYSLLDREDEQELIPLCVEHGIAYVPFGPLAGGWLTGKYRRGEAFPEGSRMTQRPGPYEAYVSESVFDGLEALAAEAEARGVDLPTLAFAWVLASPGVTGAVCGPMRAAQLEPVLAAEKLALDQAERDRIGAFFS
ncbi:MAG TPA: aldo/keto reductase [Gaiellaceae bacterium]|nr:aldo/keto reductase [Gaiellaceae bacterium]